MASSLSREERRKRILQSGSIVQLLNEPGGKEILEAESRDDDRLRLIEPQQLQFLERVRGEARAALTRPQLFWNTADVIVVPGFLGSSLSDVKGPYGLIWIDPTLVFDKTGEQLGALQLAPLQKTTSSPLANVETDQRTDVDVQATGALPAQFDLLNSALALLGYGVTVFPFDWRKDLERSAMALASQIGARRGQSPRPLHVIAHSQGSLVARRALQLLGPVDARRLVSNLVLLGPASYGSFSAAFAFTGDNSAIETMRRFGIEADFKSVLQSFTGLYQLLPWNKNKFQNGFDPKGTFKDPKKWTLGIDAQRLNYGFEWGSKIDTTFFDDRTTIILGDQQTAGAVEFDAGGHIVATGPSVQGDGTVTDANARLKDVRTYRMPGGEHMKLPMYLTVIEAVRSILKGNSPSLPRPGVTANTRASDEDVVVLENIDAQPPASAPKSLTARIEDQARQDQLRTMTAKLSESSLPQTHPECYEQPELRPAPPTPQSRRLRVFSCDPLLATHLDGMGIATITLHLPWDGDRLLPGPIGDAIEVVDCDPASRRFYHPVDLNDPRLVAQDGLPPAESNPQFHQQMAYAVSMVTLGNFERALGRTALWAPHFERDAHGEVIPPAAQDQTFVPRLRLYPHAFRDANAYYDPERHAILFGYFPSNEQPGGETLPGGVIFTSQSFDIIAHETTHALLHGLHRYYLEPSNRDVLAFHEGFADAVALFEKFSYIDVVRSQIAKTKGDLWKENLLGQLAQQFGAAMGAHRAALRQYLDKTPDPTLYATAEEPHERGAILMAALFRAFLNIYEFRTRDLLRLATNGTGELPPGDITPDLVNRLAQEACTTAQQFLTMCVRALDYIPPIDLTFGEYLRALITADYELVRDDDLQYRVGVIDAFRSWGLYPEDVNVLDQTAVLWRHPCTLAADVLRGVVRKLDLDDCTSVNRDRRAIYLRMQKNCLIFRDWIYEAADMTEDHMLFGILVFSSGFQSVPRNAKKSPKFEVHSVRTCLRIGPDGQQLRDLVVEIVQRRAGYLDPAVQKKVDEAKAPWAFTDRDLDTARPQLAPPPDFWFRGGCTLIIDVCTGTIRYAISKSILSEDRLEQQRSFTQNNAQFGLASTYFDTHRDNPFALLHTGESIYGS